MSDRDPDEELSIELTQDEAELLAQGLEIWGDCGNPTDSLARAMGFRNVGELWTRGNELAERIRALAILTRRDWTQAIMALEIGFASDTGGGWEWSDVTGFDDEYSIRVVRAIQYKLIGVRLLGKDAEPIV